MNTLKTATAALALSVLSFSAFAAPMNQTTQNNAPYAGWRASDIEAGTSIQPGAASTGQSMNDAFTTQTLVAGDWS
ncbi:hypothetical protein SMZ82_000511 [Cronobacter malonaticus]|uniref:Uncharacterized protein n=1 Tax=Cronobacter malonaticus TaxID=413503 RepID=V5U016_9ENTR|nr:hypothetical protein [Cronobacter malonaticus]CCJ96470.1 FIG00553395: hypothetical protein [Cronobacter malonaticus 681]CCJ97869.1 FIG00553395: hypothetical protein [Cronobacter malonaticus 507]AHB70718.1 hypothetical protein P262_03305 [Cronobacter malonaticus]ALX78931.1 hypothetical protein AFK66_011155 [Cronobacter malonaticus LMG 23826]EGT4278040.1 hypothetical protein [Cronobacter malonaticus]